MIVDNEFIEDTTTKIRRSLESSKKGKGEATLGVIDTALTSLDELSFDFTDESFSWAETVSNELKQLIKKLEVAEGFSKSDNFEQNFLKLSEYVDSLCQDLTSMSQAKSWVLSAMPIFIYLDDYPVLDGHQDIKKYLGLPPHENASKTEYEIEAEKNFAKLLTVAGLDAEELQKLLGTEPQRRQQLVNRAGAVVTRKLRQLWRDRRLKVRFDVDAEHFNTLVSDDESEYDVEINLNDRSKGFKWFFSFYITFTADTQAGDAKNAILLLDEPGLFLHATGQRDLLTHFAQDFSNQIIYTTHSPFMIPVDDISSIRTVKAGIEEGTTVTNDPTGDEKTLFPIQSALGYEIAQDLLIKVGNLAVEGVTDYWYLSSASSYLAELGKPSLPEGIAIVPAGSAQRIAYMVTLLTSQKLKVVVLFDREKKSTNEADRIVKQKLIRNDSIVFCDEAFPEPKPSEADIEDLLDPVVFDQLIKESYGSELDGITLKLNPQIPRIAKRYEVALKEVGLQLHKTRPARLFMRKIASEPEAVLSKESIERFCSLFSLINEKLERLIKSERDPFQ